jgi:hypothetical protein
MHRQTFSGMYFALHFTSYFFIQIHLRIHFLEGGKCILTLKKPQMCINLVSGMQNLSPKITVKSTKSKWKRLAQKEVCLYIHLLFAYVDVMTHERCKASQYVGAGLGGRARSGLVVSVHDAQRAEQGPVLFNLNTHTHSHTHAHTHAHTHTHVQREQEERERRSPEVGQRRREARERCETEQRDNMAVWMCYSNSFT